MKTRFRHKKVLWFVLLSLGIFGSGLTTVAQTGTLTLAQAVEMALEADYQVKTDINTLEKYKLAVKKAALDIFPQATVEGQYQYLAEDNTYPKSYQITIKETIPTTYNLYGQKIVSEIEAAMWDQVSAEAALQIDQAEVIYNTYEDYLTILKDQQVVKQYEQAVATYKKENELALKQLSLGKITKPDQLQIENYLNQAEFNLVKSRSDLNIALKKLANQIGLKGLTGYLLEETVPEAPVLAQELSALQQQALQKRLELQEDEINIKKARRAWAQAKNEELPTVSFSYNDRNQTNYFGLSYDFLSGDFSWLAAQGDESSSNQQDLLTGSSSSYFGSSNKYYTLKLSWSFGFGSAANATKQSKYSLENAELELERERQEILLEVEQALTDYQLAVEQHEVDRKALPYYEKDLEIKHLQKELGAITCNDFYEAMQNALEARVTAVKSSYDWLLALQKLKKAVGDLYPFDHISVLEEKRP